MAHVVMNVVDVPEDRQEEFERRFANRAAQVQGSPGFEAFELLKPETGGKYIVYTRWTSKDDFEAWLRSPAFAEGHRQHSTHGPVAPTSETWSFDVLQSEYGD
ncbi:MAG TPA: antibiotic biosynthesis monooxygenase [Actinomycetota bacterium]|jgi:heme-degrading monooxygenase HmoA|nr:antibiotic biosynthesis monooxygenase [Actinomycetota bacterium]